MSEVDLDLDEISALFAEAAAALRAAQDSLDDVRLPVPGAEPHDALTYAVTRADFEINAQLQKVKTKVVLLFKKKRRTEVDRHSMRFALLAVPDAPPPPDLSTKLPPVPPALAPAVPPAVPLPSFEVALPPFLLTISEERRICKELSELLRRVKAGDYEDKMPPGVPLKPEDVHTEGNLLAADCENLRPPPKDDYQRGAVFFRLDDAVPATLVIRADDEAENVSVYIYRPEARPPVAIYSTRSDSTKALSYEPIQLLLDALRAGLHGSNARREAHPAVDPQIGLKFLPKVLHAVWNGYLDALHRLQPPQTSPPGGPRHTFFDLPGVEAHLSYASPQLPPPDDDSAGGKGGDEGEIGNHVIETRARLRVERRTGHATCTMALDGAEFVLTGASRDFITELIRKQAEKIAEKFDDGEPGPYLQALHSDEMRRDAVILLLFSSDKIPKPHFLVTWPGRMASVVQDFMFKCELKVEKDGSKLENINKVRPMQQAARLVRGRAVQPDLTGEQYEYWHRFFKAVRRWRVRVEPPTG